jgi:hypothetical protein
VTLHAKCISPLIHTQKTPPGFPEGVLFSKPVLDYIVTLHAKSISPLIHPQKKKHPLFPGGCLVFITPFGITL